jgi:hypothetical protein
MADLTDLSAVAGDELTESQIRGILAQIDLDIMNLVRAANLQVLLAARAHYEHLLAGQAGWEISVAECGCRLGREV